jgi:polyketide cyclase/dehydrase/lipid transport protein
MQTLDHDSVSLHIDAPAEVIYEMVADVTRTPEFSPEILWCKWLDGATGPAVGARFAARNKVPRRPPWTNKPVVTIVDPGKTFEVSRTEKFAGTVVWNYQFVPEGDGTLVTESYRVTVPLSWFGWFIISVLFNRRDRRTDLRNGMEETLQRMRAVAERAPSSSRPDSSSQAAG